MSMITKLDLVEPFKKTLGVEMAETLFQEIAGGLGFTNKSSFSEDECIKILKTIKAKGGLMSIMATTITTRMVLKGQISPTQGKI